MNVVAKEECVGHVQKRMGTRLRDYKKRMRGQKLSDDWVGARDLCCSTVVAEEWESVYRFLYENLSSSKKFQKQEKWESGIVAIADHLYKHGICADPEINAAALFITLSTV